MPETEMRSFEDFWPFYVREHAHPTNRKLHFVGTTLAMASLAAGLVTRRRAFFLAAPVLGYGFAWVGHFFVEGNKPATFRYPLWSLRGDLVMWRKMATGTMDAEVARVTSANGVQHAADEQAPASHEAPHTVN
jgi:hypothetical protein